jgi:hypothetical protein
MDHLKDFTIWLRNEGPGNTGKHNPIKSYFYCERSAGAFAARPGRKIGAVKLSFPTSSHLSVSL